MNFEKNKTFEKIGEKTGFATSYVLFTLILFIILSLLSKIPNNWSFMHIAGITLTITIVGIIIKRILR
jgi:hypothetical protein|tara:strand:+ start:247 stop:450 length:204 start_codon:yes stop_codon:yes gene_type:complete